MNASVETLSPAAAWYRPAVYYYGGALILIGLASVVLGGIPHWTALIPAMLGVVAFLAGFAARQGATSEFAASACAVAIPLYALSDTAAAVPVLPYALAGSAEIADAGAVIARAATALVSGGFVVVILVLWWRVLTSPGTAAASWPAAALPSRRPGRRKLKENTDVTP